MDMLSDGTSGPSLSTTTLRKQTRPCNILYFLKSSLESFDSFLILGQNIDYGYTLESPRQAKIRKIGIPLRTTVLLYKSGVLGGIHYI